MAIAATKDGMPSNNHESVSAQAAEFYNDIAGEMKQEVQDFRGGGQPIENPNSDLVVRKHVLGLIIFLFGLVAVVLLLSIGGIWIAGHGIHFKP